MVCILSVVLSIWSGVNLHCRPQYLTVFLKRLLWLGRWNVECEEHTRWALHTCTLSCMLQSSPLACIVVKRGGSWRNGNAFPWLLYMVSHSSVRLSLSGSPRRSGQVWCSCQLYVALPYSGELYAACSHMQQCSLFEMAAVQLNTVS